MPEERKEVRALAEFDRDEKVLAHAEKAFIEERFRDLEANPHTSLSLEEAEPNHASSRIRRFSTSTGTPTEVPLSPARCSESGEHIAYN